MLPSAFVDGERTEVSTVSEYAVPDMGFAVANVLFVACNAGCGRASVPNLKTLPLPSTTVTKYELGSRLSPLVANDPSAASTASPRVGALKDWGHEFVVHVSMSTKRLS